MKNHSDSDPDQPPTPVVVEHEQAYRAAVATVARIEAGPRADDGAYVAGIRREILTGPDPDRRNRIRRHLDAGHHADDIATVWATAPNPTGTTGPPHRDPGPDLKAMYQAQAERTRATFDEQLAAPAGNHRAGLAAARAATRTPEPQP